MSNQNTELAALHAAIDRAGSQAALARICGVTQTAVWQWVHRMKRMPADYVLKAEQATGVSCHELRPDIYPIERVRRSRRGKVVAA
jgi:DNA-binding transcriptional regulator YdaS (Cro superfamily)